MQIPLPYFMAKWEVWKVAVVFGISVVLFGMGLFNTFITPTLLKATIKSQINLTPRSPLFEFYVKIPFPLDFKVHLFNLTNPDEVTAGGKPKIHEVGPYFFEEWKEKFDLVDIPENDTLKYHFKNTYYFRSDLSGQGVTGQEIITMPHPLITAMVLAVNVDRKSMLSLVTAAIDVIFDSPQHMYWTGKAWDLLFDGIFIDCSDEDSFQAAAVCDIFENGEVSLVKPHNDTHYRFSLLGDANGTDLGEFTVFRGKKKNKDIGHVVALDGQERMDKWRDECNEYIGTDSTVFAPYTDVNDGIWGYEPTVCRSLGAHYIGKSKYMGVKTAEFTIDIAREWNSPECFCREPGKCTKKGTFDLFQCLGAPFVGSLPHFYNSDPTLLENFESGLNPNKEDHSMYMHFEMITGTPMKAAKRLQFNLEMVPVEEIAYMANLREMYYPMFWVEEQVALSKKMVNLVKYSAVLTAKIVKVLAWFGYIAGTIGIILSGATLALLFLSDVDATSSASKIDVGPQKK